MVVIVDVVRQCVGQEFDEDINAFERRYGRSLDYHEIFIDPQLYSYGRERKIRFINCEKQKNRTLLEMDDYARVNVSFRL